MNKEDLQQNNTDLKKVREVLQSLPTAKSWGGGAPVIEISTEDIIIPSFTNVDITVKCPQSAFHGTFTKVATRNIFTIPTKFPPKYIMYGGDYYEPGYRGSGYICLSLNENRTAYTTLFQFGYYSKSYGTGGSFSIVATAKINDNGNIEITDKSIITGGTPSEVSTVCGLYV